jgi:hypothetical protein
MEVQILKSELSTLKKDAEIRDHLVIEMALMKQELVINKRETLRLKRELERVKPRKQLRQRAQGFLDDSSCILGVK